MLSGSYLLEVSKHRWKGDQCARLTSQGAKLASNWAVGAFVGISIVQWYVAAREFVVG